MTKSKLFWMAMIAALLPYAGRALECISHRGLVGAGRENTIDAIERAWAAGADIVEIDLRILKDDTIILFHDASVDDAKVATLSYPEMQKLTPGYHVPTLGEAIAACTRRQTLLLDLKDDSPRFIDKLLARLSRVPDGGPQFHFQSRSMKILRALSSRLDSPVLLYVSSLDRSGPLQLPPDPTKLSTQLTRLQISGISAKGRQFIDRNFVNAFQKRGLLFYVWTINPLDRMQHYRTLGVDGIITDCPARVRAQGKESGS